MLSIANRLGLCPDQRPLRRGIGNPPEESPLGQRDLFVYLFVSEVGQIPLRHSFDIRSMDLCVVNPHCESDWKTQGWQ